MDHMVSESHLVLFLSFIKVSVKHLQNSVFGIYFSIMVLLVDVDVLLKLFRLSNSHNLPPVSEQFQSIEMGHLGLFQHVSLQFFASHLHQLLFFVKIFHRFVLVLYLNEHSFLFKSLCCFSFDLFSKSNHLLNCLI